MNLLQLLAQTTESATGTGKPPPDWLTALGNPMFLMLLLVGVLWVFMLGGKRKEEKQRTSMLSQLKKGDRIQTVGGVLGTVIEARENEVLVKVDETTNAKIRFTRSAIHRVLEDEKAENK